MNTAECYNLKCLGFFPMCPSSVWLTPLVLSDFILKYAYFYLTPGTSSLTVNSVTSMKTLTTLQAGAFNPVRGR